MPISSNKDIQPISAVIITYNEAENIELCIKSCSSICDEVIVVDSHSSDDTVAIARKLGAQVYVVDWKGYGPTKNFGASKAKHDWILSLDADERLDAELQTHISELELDRNGIYTLDRINFIGDRKVLHGEWYPDVKPRLYNKNSGKWTSDAVHERLEYSDVLEVVKLKGELLHYSFSDLQDLELRLDKYARLSAAELAKDQSKKFKITYVFKSIFRFLKSYVLKRGFLDGNTGYQIARLNANAIMKRYRYYKENLKSKTGH